MPNTNTTISTASTTFLNKTYYVRLMLETAKNVGFVGFVGFVGVGEYYSFLLFPNRSS